MTQQVKDAAPEISKGFGKGTDAARKKMKRATAKAEK
jgi:hypothetical protein